MNKNLLFIILTLLSFSTYAFDKKWNALSSSQPSEFNLSHHSTGATTTVTFNLPGFYTDEVETPRGNAFSISIPGGGKSIDAGMPDLSHFAFSIIIPDDAEMSAEITSSQFFEYSLSVAPSKGNLKRNIDPSQVPFTYSEVYSSNSFYPTNIISLRSPYILRDLRGQSVVVTPFQYNPVTNTLRVYYKLTLNIKPTGNRNPDNAISRNKPFTSVDPAFALIYQQHFLNYSSATYTPLSEHGKMLVIAETSLMSAMEPFISWKNKIGQPTELVDISVIGTDPYEIKTYIEDYYQNNTLTFVLLVGDGPQIPPFSSQWGDSDPSYGYISGNDSYAEVIVGRFSAETVAEVETQVQRSIDYEMNPDPIGQWYSKGVCIGSDQGPGDDNEMDFEHERAIREDLILNNYSLVDELYDGSQGQADALGNPVPIDLVNSLNDGRGVVNYTGHGSQMNLVTTNFSISEVPALTNVDQLPFIWSVACVNGDFRYGHCLAEELLRSTDANGDATGAVATYMATINQSWNPPMDAQDEMVDLLVESYTGNVKHTFGGISVSGCMHMNDVYGGAGDEMTDTWHTFGDPSLMVRTRTPFPLAVTHSMTIDELQTSFNVSCPTDNAQICLSKDNEIVSSGWSTSGMATLNISSLTAGDTLDIVATAFNAIPYISTVIVTPASTTGIDESKNRQFSIYPNPVNNELTVTFGSNLQGVHMRLINALGQTVSHEFPVSSADNFKMNVSHLAPGIYSLEILNEQGLIGLEKVVVR